jgi:hypothetical protein
MSARLFVASVVLLAGAAWAFAGEREEKHSMEVQSDAALGFGIQGEHFDGLPVDAATIGGPKRGPAAKLDSEESIDAKDDNPDPALGPAGPSPLGMPEPARGTGQ